MRRVGEGVMLTKLLLGEGDSEELILIVGLRGGGVDFSKLLLFLLLYHLLLHCFFCS